LKLIITIPERKGPFSARSGKKLCGSSEGEKKKKLVRLASLGGGGFSKKTPRKKGCMLKPLRSIKFPRVKLGKKKASTIDKQKPTQGGGVGGRGLSKIRTLIKTLPSEMDGGKTGGA